MKHILISILLIGTAFCTSGQVFTDKIDSEWSENLKLGKKSGLKEVIGADATGFYSIILQKKGLMSYAYKFLHVDNNMNLTKTVALKMPKAFKDYKYKSTLYFSDNIYILADFYSKRKGVRDIKAFKVDKKTLKISDQNPIDLASIKFESKRNTGNIVTIVSEKSNAIAFRMDLPFEEGEPEKALYKVYDKNFKILWEAEYENTIDGKEGVLSLNDSPMIDEEGNLYSYNALYKGINAFNGVSNREMRKGMKNEKITSSGYLSMYLNGNDKPIHIAMDVEELDQYEFKINPLDNGNIAFTGLYSDEDKQGMQGVFYFEIDAAKEEIRDVKKQSFSEDFLTQFWSSKDKKRAAKVKKKKEKRGKSTAPSAYNYDIRDVFFKDNGDMCMVAEQFYVRVVSHTHTDAQGRTYTTYTYYYYYKDLILTNYDSNGNITWIKKIPKRQMSVNDGGTYLSYYGFTKNNKVYFVFNDNAKNLNIDADVVANSGDGVEWLKWRDAVCALATVDNDGNVEREWMFNLKEEKVLAFPKLCQELENGDHMLYTKRGKKTKFVKFHLK